MATGAALCACLMQLLPLSIKTWTGITPFMASIEAAKRAFGEEEAAQRRRHRTAREKKGLDGGARALGAAYGGGGGEGGECSMLATKTSSAFDVAQLR